MRPEYQMSYAALKQLLHRNAPRYAMSAVGLGRVETSERPRRVERLLLDCAIEADPFLSSIGRDAVDAASQMIYARHGDSPR